jgi:hypothetical protein
MRLPRGCCRRLVGNRVFRRKLAGVLDAPLPFLSNIKSDGRVSPSVAAFL